MEQRLEISGKKHPINNLKLKYHDPVPPTPLESAIMKGDHLLFLQLIINSTCGGFGLDSKGRNYLQTAINYQQFTMARLLILTRHPDFQLKKEDKSLAEDLMIFTCMPIFKNGSKISPMEQIYLILDLHLIMGCDWYLLKRVHDTIKYVDIDKEIDRFLVKLLNNFVLRLFCFDDMFFLTLFDQILHL